VSIILKGLYRTRNWEEKGEKTRREEAADEEKGAKSVSGIIEEKKVSGRVDG